MNKGVNDAKVMALMALAANFGKEFPECLLPIWLELLKPYPANVISEGVQNVILSYEYKTIPPFAVLKRYLDKAVGAMDQDKMLEMQAEAEWGKLLDAIQSLGVYKGPPQMHPATEYALRNMGGWLSACCHWDMGKIEWRRKEFLEIWKMANGNEEIMALGANGVAAIAQGMGGMESVGCIAERLLGNGKHKIGIPVQKQLEKAQ